MIYYIACILILVCVSCIAVIVLRHWKEIRLLNPNSIKEEQEKQKRDELILQRFTRVTAERMVPVREVVKRGIDSSKTGYRFLLRKLTEAHDFYNKAKTPFASLSPSTKEKVKVMLEDARELAREEKWAEAERRYIEILSIDAHEWEAYKGLGQIYLKQNLLLQARETFEFLVKSKKVDDIVYAGLGDICESTGDLSAALDMRKKAVDLKPLLAVRQFEMASLYVKMGDVVRAWPCAVRACELDEGNCMDLELSLDIAILMRNREEALKRFDTLRVLTEDRGKIEGYRGRIEML